VEVMHMVTGNNVYADNSLYSNISAYVLC